MVVMTYVVETHAAKPVVVRRRVVGIGSGP